MRTTRALLTFSVLLFTAPAFGQDPEGDEEEDTTSETTDEDTTDSNADAKRAKMIYNNGVELYEEGLYEQSITAFQEAYELSGEPKLLYNVANAQERLGDLQASLDTLNTYRIYASDEEKEKLDRRIRSLERRIDEEKAAADEAAAAAASNATAAVVETKPNVAKWVIVGSGGALAVGFGTVSAITYSNGQRFADDCATNQDIAGCSESEASYQSNRNVNNIALPIAGVGAGLAVVGLILPSQRQVTITPNPFGATAHVRF